MSENRELPVLIGPGAEAAEALLLIGAPDRDGVVHIRGWSAEDWSAMPESRAERAASLLLWFEDQSRRGRTFNQSLYAIRLWLNGGTNESR